MVKDFQIWGVRKNAIQTDEMTRYFYEREVWWSAVGCNVGYEEDGKNDDFSRPVLILRKFNHHFFLGVPLSTTGKMGKYYHRFECSPGYVTALLSQVRAFDARRLLRKDGSVSAWDHAMVRMKLAELLF
jgi:mRNA interferase MazF